VHFTVALALVDFHLISKYNNDEWTTKIESIIKTIRDNDGVLYN